MTASAENFSVLLDIACYYIPTVQLLRRCVCSNYPHAAAVAFQVGEGFASA
jgi:hypothetical protein